MAKSSFRRLSMATLSLALGCASSGGAITRTFERPELKNLTVESLEVVVSVSGPPVASAPVLNVPAFQSPNWTSVLRAEEEDPDSRDALVGALRRRLRAAGYAVRFRHSGGVASTGAPAPAAPRGVTPPPATATSTSGGLPTAAQPRTETSTAPTPAPGSSIRAVAPPAPSPAPGPTDEGPLELGVTLRDVLDDSTADAVLVVRAVPVDAFYVFESRGQQVVVDDSLGAISNQNNVEARSTLRSGRLLVGQAFLFDRKTGLRLWSRQLPGFPEDGRLVEDSKLLEFGVVTAPGARELMPKDKAAQASAAFVTAMLGKFGDARKGSAEARLALEKLDASDEQAKQGFLDEGHFAVAVDTSWSLETVGLPVIVEEEKIDDLGPGAITPSGVLRLTPRLGYQWPGGFTASVGVPLGLAPNQFSRSYHLDNPNPNQGDPNDIGAQVTVGRPVLGGLEIMGGYRFVLASQLLLQADVGLYGELWSLDASPLGVVPATRLYRFGAVGGGNLTYRFTPTGPFFTRAGLRGRLGWASRGPAVAGFDLVLGLGVFL